MARRHCIYKTHVFWFLARRRDESLFAAKCGSCLGRSDADLLSNIAHKTNPPAIYVILSIWSHWKPTMGQKSSLNHVPQICLLFLKSLRPTVSRFLKEAIEDHFDSYSGHWKHGTRQFCKLFAIGDTNVEYCTNDYCAHVAPCRIHVEKFFCCCIFFLKKKIFLFVFKACKNMIQRI